MQQETPKDRATPRHVPETAEKVIPTRTATKHKAFFQIKIICKLQIRATKILINEPNSKDATNYDDEFKNES